MKARNELAWIIACAIMACSCQSTVSTEDVQSRANALFNEPEDYPEFIYEVQPEPGAAIRLSDPSDWMWIGVGVGDVCAFILHDPLIRPGDDLYFFESVELVVDGNPLDTMPSHSPTDILTNLYDENGRMVASGSYSDVICWNVDLSPGIHVADFYVRTSTDEEYTYSWAFEITE